MSGAPATDHPPLAAPGRLEDILLRPPASEPYGHAAGPYHIPPRLAARPRNVSDVVALVEWAAAEGLALVPRGAGTGMPGHNVGGAIVMDLAAHLDRIEPPDAERRTVRVGPGAVAARVADAAARAGLYLPPLPSSADRCTVGGMVGTNAAGARSFLHGATHAWVTELEVVHADGTVATLGPERPVPPPYDALRRTLSAHPAFRHGLPDRWPRVRKNSSGYALDRFLAPDGDPARLLVGSEGTLGIVTSVTLRLTAPAAGRAVLLLGLPTLEGLGPVADAAEAAGASACEYLGRRILEMARLDADPAVGDVAAGATGLVLVEFEGDRESARAGLDRMGRLAERLGGRTVTAHDDAARDRLWHLRHRASPTIAAAAERGLHSLQFIEDCVVPRHHLARFVEELRGILDRADTDAVVFGHAGDGNLHVNPLVDRTRPDWRSVVRTILDETVDLVAGLGGTLSGEHGDGRVRAPFLERIWGAEVASAFRETKHALDPRGVLNPGVILPLEGQDPLEGMDV